MSTSNNLDASPSVSTLNTENLSMASAATRDGVTTDSLSVPYHTRSLTQPSRTTVDKWLEHIERQDTLLKELLDPILDLASDEHDLANTFMNGEDLKTILKEAIKRSREEIAAFQELRTKSQVPVKLLPFSRVKKEVLEEIGVIEWDAANDFEEQFQRWIEAPGQKVWRQIMQQYWGDGGAYASFRYFADLSAESTPNTFEASSRKVIDNVFLGVADLTKRWNRQSKNELQLIQVPEMKFRPGPAVTKSGMPLGALPIPTKDAKVAYMFTGSVDYGLALSAISENTVIRSVIEDLESTSNAAEVLYNHTVYILVVEAKRSQELESLKKHEPQVIAEAMAGVTAWSKERRKAQLLQQTISQPWCLTDGEEWVFGLVVYVGREGKWYNIRLTKATNSRNNPNELQRLMSILIALMTGIHTQLVNGLKPILRNVHQ